MGTQTSSIMQTERESIFSGRTDNLERHHIFGGSNRKWSEKYGLTVWLTHDEHNEPPFGVHHCKAANRSLQRAGQLKFQEVYPHLDFMKIFGRNYLDADDRIYREFDSFSRDEIDN